MSNLRDIAQRIAEWQLFDIEYCNVYEADECENMPDEDMLEILRLVQHSKVVLPDD